MDRSVVERGDVVFVKMHGAIGSEKKVDRPCVVVQNNRGNAKSPLTIVVPLTDAENDRSYPEQAFVPARFLGPKGKDSVAECGHVRAIDKKERIAEYWSQLPPEIMLRIDAALRRSLELN